MHHFLPCAVFAPHWSNDPTRGNFLLSGAVLGAASGLGWDHSVCLWNDSMHVFQVFNSFCELSWMFYWLQELGSSLEPWERKGSSWTMAHAGDSLATGISRCVQRNREPKHCCCWERFDERSNLLKINVFHMQWGVWRVTGTSNNSQKQADSQERVQPHSRAPREVTHIMLSARWDFSVRFKGSLKKTCFFSRQEVRLKMQRIKTAQSLAEVSIPLPVVTLCFLMCLCYFRSVCCAGVQRSWLWQLLSLQCWWRVQGPDIQLIPGPSVWVWRL